MTATIIESLIESTLAEHWRASVSLGHDVMRFKCQCGHTEPTIGSGHGSTRTWSRAHQSRAVLAAISEAGNVEVVTGYGVKLRSGDVERRGVNVEDAKDWFVDMVGGDDPDYEPAEVVTRTTTTITIRTDWMAVEL